ncbi:MAG: EAL domain-containing protein, partial [Pseudomonadota bacterium]
MRLLAKLKAYWVEILIILFGVVLFEIAAVFEALELFYEFSRAHEDWELDEIFVFFLVATMVLPVYLWHSNRRLKRALQAKSVAEERATHLARHDALTGLHNRLHLMEHLGAMIDTADGEAGVPAVLLLDLDQFKQLNDQQGHETGDRTLQEVAGRLVSACHEGEKAFRLGGDEFALVLQDSAALDLSTSLARRILTEFQKPFMAFDAAIDLGVSIGIAQWEAGLNVDELIKQADQAMYFAKVGGKGQYAYFDAALGARLDEQAAFEQALRRAIELREIVPYFQPFVDIDSRELKGFEVLSRWERPDGEVITPDRFITLAEDLGLIGAMTWQVLREACATAAAWEGELSLAFNLSPKQFGDDALHLKILRILEETGFPPERLEIEITENAIIEDVAAAKVAMNSLKALGVRVSLDDFGTGFSSLATLSHLPFDKLKIDRSFISSVQEHPQNKKIVS